MRNLGLLGIIGLTISFWYGGIKLPGTYTVLGVWHPPRDQMYIYVLVSYLFLGEQI